MRELKWWEYPAIFVWTVGGLFVFFYSMYVVIHGPMWAAITILVCGFSIAILGKVRISQIKKEWGGQ